MTTGCDTLNKLWKVALECNIEKPESKKYIKLYFVWNKYYSNGFRSLNLKII
jgi:hypothetical protein